MPNRRTIYFTGPRQIELREEGMPQLNEDQVLVEVLASAVSSGTEMLLYRGQLPRKTDSLDSLSSGLRYPTSYGYANVGRVKELGKSVDKAWQGRSVFGFQPHTSHYVTSPDTLLPIPESLSVDTAVFLPNMETAVNFLQDSAPILGERTLVFGQGVVGLLSAALLSEFPLEALVTVDTFPRRREASLALGLSASLDPTAEDFHARAQAYLKNGADLTLELSGSPVALNDAIALTNFSGRIVIGSWYGEKRAPLDLGGKFHRSRIRLISSQVSSIAPELSGRWDKARRFGVAWQALERIRPEKWITNRFPLSKAQEAYHLLDENPQETIQVIFQYAT